MYLPYVAIVSCSGLFIAFICSLSYVFLAFYFTVARCRISCALSHAFPSPPTLSLDGGCRSTSGWPYGSSLVLRAPRRGAWWLSHIYSASNTTLRGMIRFKEFHWISQSDVPGISLMRICCAHGSTHGVMGMHFVFAGSYCAGNHR